MEHKYRILLKDTAVFAIGNMGSRLILFFLVPLYTSYLTSSEYGTSDLVFTVAQLLLPFVTVVIFDAVVRFGLMPNERKEDIILVGIMVWTLGSIAMIGLTPLIGLYGPISDWKWYLCTYVISASATLIEMNYLKVKGKNRTYAIISIFQTAALAGLNVWFLAFLHIGVKGYLCANIIAQVTTAIVSFAVLGLVKDLRIAKFNKTLFKRMVLYSAPLILNNISWWVIHSSDKIMIETMIGAAALGLYTVASKIPALINVIISIFQQSWGLSSIHEMETSNDTNFYSTVFKGYSFLTFSACIGLVTIIKPFMGIYVGEDFFSAWVYVPLLLVSAVFSSIASYFGTMYGALKKSLNSMVTTVCGAVVNIVVNFIFINLVGVWGAVIGTVVAYALLANLRMINVRKYVKIRVEWTQYIINVSIVCTQAILASMDFYVYVASVCCILAFVLNNLDQIKSVIRYGKNRIKQSKK